MTDSTVGKLVASAKAWLQQDPDPTTCVELERLLAAVGRGEPAAIAELQDSFGQRLEFGTAGLRGVLGPGPNRMNRALVRRVTSGLARYLHQTQGKDIARGVVVGYDGRRMSREFAEDTARVLAGAGIPVLRFDDFAPTPLVAFAVKHLGACAGVVVTASHNPPEYNGYKVYWSNGAQIIPPHDRGISACIEQVGSLAEVMLADADAATREGLVRTLPQQVSEDYLAALAALRRHPDMPRDLCVVYTPMHGVGGKLVRAALERDRVRELHVVPEQAAPDGAFPTVRFPNPEEAGAMDLALALARQTGADLVLANDPDADRLAVAVPDGPAAAAGAAPAASRAADASAAAADRPAAQGAGAYRMLSGDQIGTLLGYYLLTENVSRAVPSGAKPLVMTTIVSSRLLSQIARELGARYDETLTGFKWIANRAQELAAREGTAFVLGYEEALGYSIGPVTPDKDGIGAALLFVELAAVCRQRDQTILHYLEQIYRRFGLYLTRQHSVTLPGAEGSARIAAIMEAFRTRMPDAIGGRAVVRVADYQTSQVRTIAAAGRAGGGAVAGRGANVGGGAASGGSPSVEPLELPRSNVLALTLAGGSSVLLRPSGTEPKIKYYFELAEPMQPQESYDQALARARQRLDGLVQDFLRCVEQVAG